MISIVMSTFKRTNYLKDAIKSILNQTYKDIQLIIVCVYGDKKVIGIVDSFNDKRIKKVIANYSCISYQKSLGFYSIRNSEYGMIFDSDDVMIEDSLEKLYDFSISCKADLVYPNFYISYENLEIKRIKICSRHSHKKLLKGCYITDTSFFRNKIFNRYMPLVNKDRKNRFYRIWKQMSKDKCRIFNFPHPTFMYRQHRHNIHNNKYKSQKEFECVRVGKNENFKKLYGFLPKKSAAEIDDNCFTIYFPDPKKFLKHYKLCKFKRIIIHWDRNSLRYVDSFCGMDNIYHVTGDNAVSLILKQKGLNNVFVFKGSDDFVDYIKEERWQIGRKIINE
jgi:glycosyltransferase involved in cell wall biosynthesis